MPDGHTGVLKEILPHLLLAETITMNGFYMLGAKHHNRLRDQTHAIAPDRSQCESNGVKHGLALRCGMLAYAVWGLSSEERNRALFALEPARHVERLPRILFFVLCNAERKLPRIA